MAKISLKMETRKKEDSIRIIDTHFFIYQYICFAFADAITPNTTNKKKQHLQPQQFKFYVNISGHKFCHCW